MQPPSTDPSNPTSNNATPDFGDHSAVIDGCSDLFCDVFGEAGQHSRSAVGVASLPRMITVEIEAVIAVR